LSSRIKLHLVSAGRLEQPPRVNGAVGGPFNFTDGDQLTLTITTATDSIIKTVTLRQEHFNNLAQVSAPEIAAFLDRELPGVKVAAEENDTVSIIGLATGGSSELTVDLFSPVAIKLGLEITTFTHFGSSASSAQLIGAKTGPFVLASGDRLNIRVDGRLTKTITFDSAFFPNIAQATAAEVVVLINRALPGLARVDSGKIKLVSPSIGETSFVAIDVTASGAAPKLGFGAPPTDPGLPPQDDTEPAAFEDNAGNVWLFWRSRRDGSWKIWYNRFNGTAWGTTQRLTAGTDPEFSPAVVFDPASAAPASGKIWV